MTDLYIVATCDGPDAHTFWWVEERNHRGDEVFKRHGPYADQREADTAAPTVRSGLASLPPRED
jgi:hypothetical protein